MGIFCFVGCASYALFGDEGSRFLGMVPFMLVRSLVVGDGVVLLFVGTKYSLLVGKGPVSVVVFLSRSIVCNLFGLCGYRAF